MQSIFLARREGGGQILDSCVMDATPFQAKLTEPNGGQPFSLQAKPYGLPQPRDSKISLDHRRHPTQDGAAELYPCLAIRYTIAILHIAYNISIANRYIRYSGFRWR